MVDEESAACNSIASCNWGVYSYHSVARFGSALHQKYWHRKHLRWAPELRRAPKAAFSACNYNLIYEAEIVCLCVFTIRKRIFCSFVVELAVVAGGIQGQVIAGLTAPALRFAESYLSISAFPFADDRHFLIIVPNNLRFIPS